MSNRQRQIFSLFSVILINLFFVRLAISSEIVFHEEVGEHSVIYGISPDGTKLRKIANGFFPQWSPDGRYVAYVEYAANADIFNVKGLIVIDSSGKQVADLPLENKAMAIVSHSWRPDSKALALVTTHAQNGVIKFFDITSRQIKNLKNIKFESLEEAFKKTSLEWTPDGKQLLFSTGRMKQVEGDGIESIDVNTLSIRKLSEKGMLPAIVGKKIVFIIGSEIWSMNMDGSARKKLFDTRMLIHSSSVVADKMVFQVDASKNKGVPLIKLYLLNLNDNSLKEIKEDQYLLCCPKISPDGKKVITIGMKINKETGYEEEVGYYLYDMDKKTVTLLKRFEEKKEPEQFGMQILLGLANNATWN